MTRYLPLAVALAMLALAILAQPVRTAGAQPPTPSPALSFAPVTMSPAVASTRPAATAMQTRADATSMPATLLAAPTVDIATVTQTGVISWAEESLGPGYFALSPYVGWGGLGVRVEVCGPGGCAVLVSNDVGPVRSLHRLGDVAVGVWEQVCGVGRDMGLCVVTFTRIGGRK